MEDSTKFDYKHDMQRSENWNEFNQKSCWISWSVYQNTLLAQPFKKFYDKCRDKYKLALAHFYPAPGLAGQVALKIVKVELKLLTDNEEEYVTLFIKM